jgi:hypothetical protein
MPVALWWLREEVSSSVKGPPEPAESERRMISPDGEVELSRLSTA